jgi:Methylamine utilisation protein MauE
LSELRLVVRLALGLVFAVACAAKLRRPSAFLRGVAEYDLLPRSAALTAGALLVPVEGLLAVALLSGRALGVAAAAATALLALFASAVTINLHRHRKVPCYCLGGEQDEPISPRTLARLMLLLGGALLLAADPRAGVLAAAQRSWWAAAPVAGSQEMLHALMLALLLLAAGAWLLHAPELWSLWRPRRCPGCATGWLSWLRRAAQGGTHLGPDV